MKKVLYPGSFDPITNGHINIINKACKLFDKVIIAVLKNPLKKSYLFSLEERAEIIKEIYKECNNIEVINESSVAVDAAISKDCVGIIRGLRNGVDFDYEYQLAQINSYLSNGLIETVSLFADAKYQFVSSSMIKELFNYDKDFTEFVNPIVKERMLIKKREMNYGK